MNEGNTLNVKKPVQETTKPKTKISIGLQYINYSAFCYYTYWNIAPLNASDFTGFSDSYAIPANSSDVIFSGSVDLKLTNWNYSASFWYVKHCA